MFEKLFIKRIYRSKRDNICRDFFVPLLARSCKYDRGVGYFSIDALRELSDGLIPYIKNGGSIRIITSVELKPEDLQIISQGYHRAEERLIQHIIDEIEQSIVSDEDMSIDLICNLIAAKRIEIKIAYLQDGGIYHEKIGYLED